MKIETALRKRDRLVSAIRGAYDSARGFGSTSTEMNGRLCAILYAPCYAKAPQWVRAFAEGYWRALHDEVYRYHLVFGGFIDGKFYSTHRDRPDYYEKHGIGPCEYADDGKVTGRGHYWKAFVDKGDPRPYHADPVTTAKEG